MPLLLGIMILFFSFAPHSFAQGAPQVAQQETVKAKVLNIISETDEDIPDTTTQENIQNLQIQILDGSQKGKVVEIENDFATMKKGETFYIKHSVQADGTETYSAGEPYRLPQLLGLLVIFVLAVFFLGGAQGIRGLVSLGGSMVLIIYVLLPGILHGFPPLILATVVSALIIVLGSYITHGFNKTTTSAVIGMIVTVIITGILAYVAVHWTKLTGYGSEEASYLNISTNGTIDVIGLLLGSIVIGLLGVLYDVAISQAIAVEELAKIAPHVSPRRIYERAIRIGREHIGALVNTLAIAYVGVSMPLLLLFYMSSDGGGIGPILNRELFSTEIVRTIIGSIGLILAVPITTFISVWMIMKRLTKDPSASVQQLEDERHILEHTSKGHMH